MIRHLSAGCYKISLCHGWQFSSSSGVIFHQSKRWCKIKTCNVTYFERHSFKGKSYQQTCGCRDFVPFMKANNRPFRQVEYPLHCINFQWGLRQCWKRFHSRLEWPPWDKPLFVILKEINVKKITKIIYRYLSWYICFALCQLFFNVAFHLREDSQAYWFSRI